MSRSVVSFMFIAIVLAGCTTMDAPPTTESPSTTSGDIPPDSTESAPTTAVTTHFDTGIEGTLTRIGDPSEDDEKLRDGQVLVWGPRPDEPAETTTTGITMFGRPLEAVDVFDGVFAVELSPGWYLVRGTAISTEGGEVCKEFWVEVKPQELTTVDFRCK